MRILFVAGREIDYTRNRVLLHALRSFARVDVIGAGWPTRSIVQRSARTLLHLLRHANRRYDLIVVGFYGYLLMQTLGRVARAPILFDAFISNYDTLCFDRARFAPTSLAGRALFWLDRSALARADHVLLDTSLHADYFVTTFGVPPARVTALPVGVDEALFHPLPPPARPADAPVEVIYYCTYLPLHGAEIVVQAAALLRDRPLRFRLIGDGMRRAASEALAAGLPHVTFEDALPLAALPAALAAADIALAGHFGPSAKAGRVVPGKLYQMLAMARATIAGDTPANRAALPPGSALLVPPGDPAALAAALAALAADAPRRAQLAAAGRALYERSFGAAHIAATLQPLAMRLKEGG